MSINATKRPAVWIGAGAAILAATIAVLYVAGAIGPRDAALTRDEAVGKAEDRAESAGAPQSAAEDQTTPSDQPDDARAAENQPAEAPSEKPQETTDETAEPAGEDTREAASAAPDAPQAPRIDVFRLEPDGTALVAGRAAPGWQVLLLLDGAPISSFTSGSVGAFAEFVEVPGSTAPRVLSLTMTGPDGGGHIAGETEIIIAPTPQIALKSQGSTAPSPSDTPRAAPDESGPDELARDEPGAETATDTPETDGEPTSEEAASSSTSTLAATQEAADAAPADQPPRSAPGLVALEPGSDMPAGTDDIAARPAIAREIARETQGDAAPVEESQTGIEAQQEAEDQPATSSGAAPLAQTPPQPRGLASAEQTDEKTDEQADEQAGAPAPSPTVLMADAEGVRVLQSPGAAPEVMSSVALDSISYSSDGAVQLSGRAAGTGFVRVYLDNTPITTSRISEAGTWRTDLPQVDTGVYTLRIDEVSPEGLVTSRVETPFKREDRALLAELRDQNASTGAPTTSAPEAVGAPSGTQGAPQPDTQPAQPLVRAITVQPGNTLWAISRDTYGEGILYVRVFEANSDRIRDPDLIYPGQVFELPQ